MTLYTVPKATLLTVPVGDVVGYIDSWTVEVDGSSRAWGSDAVTGQTFKVAVDAHYMSGSRCHTAMKLTVQRPDGSVFGESDDHLQWAVDPDGGAGDTIHFVIAPSVAYPPGSGFDLDQPGEWQAKLEYVWYDDGVEKILMVIPSSKLLDVTGSSTDGNIFSSMMAMMMLMMMMPMMTSMMGEGEA